MSGVAASGGYYIACEADTIIAQTTTITGSIGVIGIGFNLNELYNKIGINKSNIPIQMGRIEANLKHGIHIDLYRTFINKSIQIYAFGNK